MRRLGARGALGLELSHNSPHGSSSVFIPGARPTFATPYMEVQWAEENKAKRRGAARRLQAPIRLSIKLQGLGLLTRMAGTLTWLSISCRSSDYWCTRHLLSI